MAGQDLNPLAHARTTMLNRFPTGSLPLIKVALPLCLRELSLPNTQAAPILAALGGEGFGQPVGGWMCWEIFLEVNLKMEVSHFPILRMRALKHREAFLEDVPFET